MNVYDQANNTGAVVKKESVVDSETWEIVDKVKSKYN
jgi:hypothetical protein